jgi:hypothetical protein
MAMSEFYGLGDDTESLATIHQALELGVTLLDTAERASRRAAEFQNPKGSLRFKARSRVVDVPEALLA